MNNRLERYAEYLLGSHWRALRVELFRLRKRKCEACFSRLLIQGHHLTYREPLTLCTVDDIMLLCKRCHEIVHRDYWLEEFLRGDADNRRKRGAVMFVLKRWHGGETKLLKKRAQIERAVREEREKIDARPPLRECRRVRKRWHDYKPEARPNGFSEWQNENLPTPKPEEFPLSTK